MSASSDHRSLNWPRITVSLLLHVEVNPKTLYSAMVSLLAAEDPSDHTVLWVFSEVRHCGPEGAHIRC